MKKLTIGMAALCIILGAVFVWLRMSEDRKSPEITFPDIEANYQEGQEAAILEGVTAFDDKDGDVTDTIFIESIVFNESKTEVTVVYVAKDKSNNIARVTRKVNFFPDGTPLPTNLESDDNESSLEAAGITTDTETQTDPIGNSSTPTTTPSLATAPTTTPTANPDAPILILSKTQDSISRGASINRLSYVQDITDDKDSRESLFRKIQISGDLNSSIPGVYELIYYVIDSDGNISNNASLTITVR